MSTSKLEQLEQDRLHHHDVKHLRKMTDTERLRKLRGEVLIMAQNAGARQEMGKLALLKAHIQTLTQLIVCFEEIEKAQAGKLA